jgi:hypothetical protein
VTLSPLIKVLLGFYAIAIVIVALQGFLIAHRVDKFVAFWNGVLAKVGVSTRLDVADFRDPSFRTFGDTAILFAGIMAALPFLVFTR